MICFAKTTHTIIMNNIARELHYATVKNQYLRHEVINHTNEYS